MPFNESTIEDAALSWFGELGRRRRFRSRFGTGRSGI